MIVMFASKIHLHHTQQEQETFHIYLLRITIRTPTTSKESTPIPANTNTNRPTLESVDTSTITNTTALTRLQQDATITDILLRKTGPTPMGIIIARRMLGVIVRNVLDLSWREKLKARGMRCVGG